MFKFPSLQYGVMVGIMLSDGYIAFSHRGKNGHLYFKQSLANSRYLWFVFVLLAHFCTSTPKLTTSIREGVTAYALVLFTRALPCITELHFLFYPQNNIKIIPENIYELLTPVALAHIIMGDGSARPYGLHLCTDCYSLPDVIRLMNVLIIRYGLDCSLHKKREGQYRIYINHSSMPKLESIVGPFTCPSMTYKINSASYANRLK